MIDHLYLDSLGHPTIGVGSLISNEAAFCRLPLRCRKTNKPASGKQKRTEYQQIKRTPTGYKATWYKDKCSLYLTKKECKQLLTKRVCNFQSELSQLCSKDKGFTQSYQAMPSNVQLALLDMAFNLGTPALASRWPNFIHAIKKADWKSAAKESRRKHIPDARNRATYELLANSGRSHSIVKQGLIKAVFSRLLSALFRKAIKAIKKKF